MKAKYLSKINKFFNLIRIDKHRSFRLKLNSLLNNKENSNYDYGEGFLYQSIPRLNIRGLRDTKKRIDILELNKLFLKRDVLDIGTNIGSIVISSENNFKSCVGIDHNKDCINLANQIKNYLNLKLIEFINEDFMKKKFNQKFNLILSLANHSTYDKGIENTKLYFEKIYSLLQTNGYFIVESHSPLHESNEIFLKYFDDIKSNYKVVRSGRYNFGNYYDRGRLFFVLQKKY